MLCSFDKIVRISQKGDGLFKIEKISMSGKEILPIIEGGKGIAVSNGVTAGNWAKFGGIGTFSGVNADYQDENGKTVIPSYTGKTRLERHMEMIKFAIKGGISQAKIAHDIAGHNNGRVHMNVLWEMGGTGEILDGILSKAKNLIHGVTCGAGLPYKIGEIAAKYGVFYHPIVSSVRAFQALYKRSFHKVKELLGSVVYEDPWLAGGHNGISKAESPDIPEEPYSRVKKLRKVMRDFGLDHIPITMAGGVWWLNEWKDWINNLEIGKLAFQFGSRSLLTKESPISNAWKRLLVHLKPGDVALNKFSPTGFYSSAVNNNFISELETGSKRQVKFSSLEERDLDAEFVINDRGSKVYLSSNDMEQAKKWIGDGYKVALKTPDNTLAFVTEQRSKEISRDRGQCIGCLSACRFSGWAQNLQNNILDILPDPRSFCIQKTLQAVAHGGSVENNLVFAGHKSFRFSEDPFYLNEFIPTIKQLVERILTGF
ncbi:MAG: nitronate monooxygenase [Holosporales bacterium]|jgi:NAD(P)H-dependent flavin oxidoreductase YrpB (nitropropane dioxygenase family)|nr:nitronate monooxygenase [Holosporales bacterium]